MEKLLSMLKAIRPLSTRLERDLRSMIQLKEFRKGEWLLQQGSVADRIFFIETGVVRSYYSRGKRKVSNWFMMEGEICISICSFLEQTPSEDFLVALEDCRTWGISYVQLQTLYKRYPEFEHHGLRITTQYYIWAEKRYRDILRKTPMQKYEHLLQTNPELLKRVPMRDLGSYLNLSERTFSRIREKHANGAAKKSAKLKK